MCEEYQIPLNKFIKEYSTGMKAKLNLVVALTHQAEFLMLDEPTAGLDPAGRKELMALFETLHKNGMTLVLVTHTMDDVANFADTVFALEAGKLVLKGSPREVFQQVEYLQKLQLGVPQITNFALQLKRRGLPLDRLPIKIEELKELLLHE